MKEKEAMGIIGLELNPCSPYHKGTLSHETKEDNDWGWVPCYLWRTSFYVSQATIYDKMKQKRHRKESEEFGFT